MLNLRANAAATPTPSKNRGHPPRSQHGTAPSMAQQGNECTTAGPPLETHLVHRHLDVFQGLPKKSVKPIDVAPCPIERSEVNQSTMKLIDYYILQLLRSENKDMILPTWTLHTGILNPCSPSLDGSKFWICHTLGVQHKNQVYKDLWFRMCSLDLLLPTALHGAIRLGMSLVRDVCPTPHGTRSSQKLSGRSHSLLDKVDHLD